MSLALVNRKAALLAPWNRNELWRRARAVPSLDLRFADNKSLVDAATGQNLVSFTRASSGTYVDSQGVIRTATTNLLLRSEEFNDVAWVKRGTCAVVANDAIAPNGTLTADKVTFAGSGNDIYYGSLNVAAGTTVSPSIYVKKITASGTFTLQSANGSPNGSWSVNLSLLSTSWERLTATHPAVTVNTAFTGSGNNFSGFQLFQSSGIATELHLWGAQLEQSSTVGEYIPTTSTINSAPRFDHNPTTGESLGLLVEESRTNLLPYSACDSNWATGGFGTPTYNLGLSALGVFSGVQVASAGQNWHSIYRWGIGLTASTVYAFTLFYRAGTSGRVRLTFRNNTASTETFISGAVGSLTVGGSLAGAATLLSQYLCSDGLTYVVTGTFTPNGTSADHWYRIGPDSATTGQTVIALGAQLEAGAFPTSYIPTTTATATRSADVASISGSNFSSWYRQDEGTVFASSTVSSSSYANGVLWDIGAGGAFGSTAYCAWSGSQWTLNPSTAPLNLFSAITTSSLSTNASALQLNNSVIAANGLLGGVDSSCALPSSPTTLSIGKAGWASGNFFNGTIRRLTYWPQRLSNPTIQSITQ